MSCYYAGKDQPRMIRGRHGDGCPGGYCEGCEPCTHNHCTRCGVVHVEQLVCPGCVADARDDLAAIETMCARLLTEATIKGVHSEAMNLLGPVPDPEARQHAEASYKAGRLPEGWLETGKHGKHCPLLWNEACTGCGGEEWHPLTVAWWWNECYREALEHDETPAVRPPVIINGEHDPGFGVPDLLAYLDRNLAYVAQLEDVPFADFARALSSCRSYLEQVLHDGEQIEQGAPCMHCNVRVERTTSDDGRVTYQCPRCREVVSEAGYMLAVKAEYIKRADMLTTDDMAIRTGVPAPTIRRWANVRRIDGIEYPPLFRACARNGQGRKVYRVADVERVTASGGDTRGSTANDDGAGTVSNEGAA